MKRLTWWELGALGLLLIIGIHMAATYGAWAGLLVVALTFTVLRMFISDHALEARFLEVRTDLETARAQRDDAIAQRIREQIRSGRWQ